MVESVEFISGSKKGLRQREESTMMYTFLTWLLLDDGGIHADGVVYEKKHRLCGIKVSDEIFEDVWNHLVLGLGSKEWFNVIKDGGSYYYQRTFSLCSVPSPVLFRMNYIILLNYEICSFLAPVCKLGGWDLEKLRDLLRVRQLMGGTAKTSLEGLLPPEPSDLPP